VGTTPAPSVHPVGDHVVGARSLLLAAHAGACVPAGCAFLVHSRRLRRGSRRPGQCPLPALLRWRRPDSNRRPLLANHRQWCARRVAAGRRQIGCVAASNANRLVSRGSTVPGVSAGVVLGCAGLPCRRIGRRTRWLRCWLRRRGLARLAGVGRRRGGLTMGRHPRAVSSTRPGVLSKTPSFDTSGMPSRMAVAAIQRSASCSR